jgi:hypothetical protein
MTIDLIGYPARLRPYVRTVLVLALRYVRRAYLLPGSATYRSCVELRADVLASAT